jgi:hypothetical protein
MIYKDEGDAGDKSKANRDKTEKKNYRHGSTP